MKYPLLNALFHDFCQNGAETKNRFNQTFLMHFYILHAVQLLDYAKLAIVRLILGHNDAENFIMRTELGICHDTPRRRFATHNKTHNDGMHNLLFGLEVVIECAFGNITSLEDIHNRCFGVPFGHEQNFGRIQNFISAFLRIFHQSHILSSITSRPTVGLF
ncbi:hypothetical protein D3C74_338660 [compost metagenome]